MDVAWKSVDQLRTPSSPIGLVKPESDFTVRSVETDIMRRTLVVTVISVDVYPLLVFSDLTCHLEDAEYRNSAFWLHWAT